MINLLILYIQSLILKPSGLYEFSYRFIFSNFNCIGEVILILIPMSKTPLLVILLAVLATATVVPRTGPI